MVLGFIVIFGLRKRLLIEFISIIKTLAKEMSTYDRLAAFILNNYQGVLITRIDVDGNLNGYVFKRIGELLRCEAIVIASDSYAPVFSPDARRRLYPTIFAIILQQTNLTKNTYSHEKTLAVLTKDDRSEIFGADWYGDNIWQVFEKHHLRFNEIFEGVQN